MKIGGKMPKLSRELRDKIVQLRTVEQLSIEEIALSLDISYPTAWKYSPRGINVKEIRKSCKLKY